MWIHSFGHQLQFPSFPPRCHSADVVLYPGDCVRHPISVLFTSNPSFLSYYLSTSRELQRLDAVSKSPIFAWFSESLSGLSTIRAYGQRAIFVAHNARRIDRNQMCYLANFSVDRWVSVRLECVGSLIILFTALLAVAAMATSNVDVGLVGLVLSYALSATGSLVSTLVHLRASSVAEGGPRKNWLVRLASQVEREIVSVERIVHYTNELPSEAPRELLDSRPPAGWPGAGEVIFQ
jgi:ATP-binding cassette subfamily C (CFTR/MRP) protein 1